MNEREAQELGLLRDGETELQGAQLRARMQLLNRLVDDGVSVSDLQQAVADRRLVLLPLEMALRADEDRATPREVTEETGLSLDQLEQLRETLGLPLLDPDAREVSTHDVEAFRQAGMAVEAGVPFEGVLEINHALSGSMPGLASTLRNIANTISLSDDEDETALRLAVTARELLPMLMPVLEYALRAHLEQQVISDYVDRDTGAEEGERWAVGFADLTGFTRLSESSPADAIGALNTRLTSRTRAALSGRARLVKTIGDAVMITAPTSAEVLDVMLALTADETCHDDDLPQIRAGVSEGPLLQRAGDVFGRAVNRASRLTDHAEPGAVVCDEEARQASRNRADLTFEALGPVELRGVADATTTYRVTRSLDTGR